METTLLTIIQGNTDSVVSACGSDLRIHSRGPSENQNIGAGTTGRPRVLPGGLALPGGSESTGPRDAERRAIKLRS